MIHDRPVIRTLTAHSAIVESLISKVQICNLRPELRCST